MTSAEALWTAIESSCERDTWLPLHQIFAMVERHIQFDEDDRLPHAPGARGLAWQKNVRVVLQARREHGDVLWDARGNYKLPTRPPRPI